MSVSRAGGARSLGVATLAAAALLAVAKPVAAVDGAIELSQARIDAEGGFPFTIDAAGHYVLTSNLENTDPNAHALVISASPVTLDLNGFRLLGPASCSGAGGDVVCTNTGTGVGVQVLGTHATIRNGTIRGAGSDGIHAVVTDLRVERLRLIGNGGSGLRTLGTRSSVFRSLAWRNGRNGFEEASITESLAVGNLLSGITLFPSREGNVQRSYAVENGELGIWLEGNGTVRESLVVGNQKGLRIRAGGYGGNAIDLNGDTVSGTGAANEIAPNLCDGGPCP